MSEGERKIEEESKVEKKIDLTSSYSSSHPVSRDGLKRLRINEKEKFKAVINAAYKGDSENVINVLKVNEDEASSIDKTGRTVLHIAGIFI